MAELGEHRGEPGEADGDHDIAEDPDRRAQAGGLSEHPDAEHGNGGAD